MRINSKNISDLVHLHIIVIVLGFTGVLGRLITLPAFELVWFRMVFAALGLFVWLIVTKSFKVPNAKTVVKYLLTGAIVALHWLCFFGSIKASTVSVALACFAATTLFVSLLEPIFGKHKISILELVLGLVIIGALMVIFKFETQYALGIVLGILAALLGAVFMVINKSFQKNENPTIITFYEMLGGGGLLSILLIPYSYFELVSLSLNGNNFLWILVLALVCTCYAFMASIKVMRTLTAFQVVLTINLEPIYGIILAYIVFKDAELMTTQFYIGTFVLVGAIFAYSLLKRYNRN